MNEIVAKGFIMDEPQFSHECHGKKFYQFTLQVFRESGTPDLIKCIISENYLPIIDFYVEVRGEVRTFNKDGKLLIFVYVHNLYETDGGELNQVNIEGFICKKPIYRTTPLGREIAETIIAVNNSFGRSSYIPCIFWGYNARKVARIGVGKRISVNGRLQSRDYLKTINNGTKETRRTYELSVGKYEELENES